MRERQILRLNGFKGVNRKAVTLMLPQFLRDGNNFLVTDEGFIDKVWGSRKVAYDSHGLTNILGLFCHQQENYAILAVGDGKVKMYSGGTWAELGSSIAGGTPAVWMQSYLNNPYLFIGDRSYYYDIKTATLVDLDAKNRAAWISDGGATGLYIPIRGVSPVIHFNSLWLCGTGEFRNLVLYSKSFSDLFHSIGQGALPFTHWVSVGGDDSASGSTLDAITCAEELGPDLIVFKEKSSHRIVGTASNEYRAIPLNGSVGCLVPQSLAKTKGGLIWMANKDSGIWMYDGSMRNVSRPRIDDLLADIQDFNNVRSGYFKDRYYLLSTGKKTLIYDLDTDSWDIDGQPYGAFASFAGEFGHTLAALNVYSSTLTTAYDPKRPGDPQQILKIVPVTSNLVELAGGTAANMDADGTGGSAIPFEIVTPHFDMGNKAIEKTFCEMVVHYKCADPVLSLTVYVDGREYSGLTGTSDPRPLYDEAYFDKASFDDMPTNTCKFYLPLEATGYKFSAKITSSTKKALRIEEIDIYFVSRTTFDEDGE